MKHTPNLSLEGAAFIGAFEGFRAGCYDDAAGNCTIGFGHLVHYGPATAADRRKWGSLTRPQAARLLQADARPCLLAIERYVTVKLTGGQVDALCSFAYNCGAGALSPEHSVIAAVNSKPHRWNRKQMTAWHQRVAAQLEKWDQAGGRVLAGLRRRRLAEAVLFATGHHTRHQGNVYAND